MFRSRPHASGAALGVRILDEDWLAWAAVLAVFAVDSRPTHLRLALQNLIDNAVKYAKPDERLQLRIAAEQQDGAWIISVADNGIGFSESVRDRVFGLQAPTEHRVHRR